MWRSSRNYNEDWERKKTYLIRSLFEVKTKLSTIPESDDTPSRSPTRPPQRSRSRVCSPYRSESPLPNLIIERIPKINKHDEPEEYYDTLEKNIKKIMKRMGRSDEIENSELYERSTSSLHSENSIQDLINDKLSEDASTVQLRNSDVEDIEEEDDENEYFVNENYPTNEVPDTNNDLTVIREDLPATEKGNIVKSPIFQTRFVLNVVDTDPDGQLGNSPISDISNFIGKQSSSEEGFNTDVESDNESLGTSRNIRTHGPDEDVMRTPCQNPHSNRSSLEFENRESPTTSVESPSLILGMITDSGRDCAEISKELQNDDNNNKNDTKDADYGNHGEISNAASVVRETSHENEERTNDNYQIFYDIGDIDQNTNKPDEITDSNDEITDDNRFTTIAEVHKTIENTHVGGSKRLSQILKKSTVEETRQSLYEPTYKSTIDNVGGDQATNYESQTNVEYTGSNDLYTINIDSPTYTDIRINTSLEDINENDANVLDKTVTIDPGPRRSPKRANDGVTEDHHNKKMKTVEWETLKDKLFLRKPKVFNLCTCEDHQCT